MLAQRFPRLPPENPLTRRDAEGCPKEQSALTVGAFADGRAHPESRSDLLSGFGVRVPDGAHQTAKKAPDLQEQVEGPFLV
jgi:hypothetical protein